MTNDGRATTSTMTRMAVMSDQGRRRQRHDLKHRDDYADAIFFGDDGGDGDVGGVNERGEDRRRRRRQQQQQQQQVRRRRAAALEQHQEAVREVGRFLDIDGAPAATTVGGEAQAAVVAAASASAEAVVGEGAGGGGGAGSGAGAGAESYNPVVTYACDPCVDRPSRVVRVIVHGLSNDSFWHRARDAGVQAGLDSGVNVQYGLYDGSFDDKRMARDILEAAGLSPDAVGGDAVVEAGAASALASERPLQPNRPDALVVTVPSAAVRDAVERAAASGMPIFGFNSGYDYASGPDGMVASGSMLAFFAMDEYLGGHKAGEALWRSFVSGDSAQSGGTGEIGNNDTNVTLDDFYEALNASSTATAEEATEMETQQQQQQQQRQPLSLPIKRALYINGEKGNTALDERGRGFADVIRSLTSGYFNGTATTTTDVDDDQQQQQQPPQIDELAADASDESESFDLIKKALSGCTYDAILIATGRHLKPTFDSLDQHKCDYAKVKIGVFDKNNETFDNIVRGRIAVSISQQEHLQGSFPITFAALFASTGFALAPPADTDAIYLTGPKLFTNSNVPSDTMQRCESEAFPVCSNSAGRPISSSLSSSPSQSLCNCADRSLIRIGGVVHGVTTDTFWDAIFEPARQVAMDLGIVLDFDRFEPQDLEETLHLKMAFKILNLCQSGVDGVFVSIPSPAVEDAVRECLNLNVPVVSINSGYLSSQTLGLAHHIGMLEYNAGRAAGEKLVALTDATKFVCIDHAPGVTVTYDRCKGFEDAVLDAGDGRTYVGKMDVPSDNVSMYKKLVEEAVGSGGGWEGYAILAAGQPQLDGILEVKKAHPKFAAGIFDTSDGIYAAIDRGDLMFGMDQQPYLQGYAPVVLLTMMTHTKQQLLNHVIETGPSFVMSAPSPERRVCEANLFEVCPQTPYENMNYVTHGLVVTGVVLFSLQATFLVLTAAWTGYYRHRAVVKKSQPIFLFLIAVGCLLMSLSILPLTAQGAHRYLQDPLTGGLTDVPNEDIRMVDAACMAFPWLAGIGFVTVFSALFAKIWRVKRIFDGASRFRRETVGAKDVAIIMVVMLAVETALLLSWQLVSPLRWRRDVVSRDVNGFPTESIGYCTSDGSIPFVIAILSFKGLCLFYALCLCYVTRNVPSDLAEGKWIGFSVVSMFQTGIVGVPILVITTNNNNAFFFMRAAVIFLITLAVSAFIFLPKAYTMHFGKKPVRRDNMKAHRFSSAHGSNHSKTKTPTPEEGRGHAGGSNEGKSETSDSRLCRPAMLRTGTGMSTRLVCAECRKKVPLGELAPVVGPDLNRSTTSLASGEVRRVSFADDTQLERRMSKISAMDLSDDCSSAYSVGLGYEEEVDLKPDPTEVESARASELRIKRFNYSNYSHGDCKDKAQAEELFLSDVAATKTEKDQKEGGSDCVSDGHTDDRKE